MLELLGCLLHRSHVSIVILVAFFERQTRITGLHPLCLRRLERDVLTVGFAAVVFAEAGAAQRPARRCRDRRFDRRKTDPRYLVAVSIDLRDENWIRGATSE